AVQILLELLAHRPLDLGTAVLLENHVERHPRLQLAHDVLLGRAHREGAALTCDELLEDRAALADPLLEDASVDLAAVALVEGLRQLGVEPLGLAGLPA